MQASTSASNNKELIRKVACIECRRIFCMDCRVPWHFGRSCIDYQNLPPELRDSEDSNLYKLAKNENWQRCRKCRRMIELAEGCYHMTCRYVFDTFFWLSPIYLIHFSFLNSACVDCGHRGDHLNHDLVIMHTRCESAGK